MSQLEPAAILTELDRVCALASSGRWPTFDAGIGFFELHALRLSAYRRADAWLVVLDAIRGTSPTDAHIARFLLGTGRPPHDPEKAPLPVFVDDDLKPDASPPFEVLGPAGSLTVTDELVGISDLRPGWSASGDVEHWAFVLGVRAYLERHPRAPFARLPPPEGDWELVIQTNTFHHVVGGAGPDPWCMQPSSSKAYTTLALRLVDNTPFAPGINTTAWRLHVRAD